MKLFERAGDTIVEVMMSIAVVGAVLGAAYVAVNRAAQNNQQAAEHAEALGYAQAQVEQIANVVNGTTPGTLYSTSTTLHCFNPNGSGVLYDIAGTTLTATSAYPSQCNKGLGAAGFFSVGFQYVPATSVFKVSVFWPSATGSGVDQVTLEYQEPNPNA